jgi:hypothetical protein
MPGNEETAPATHTWKSWLLQQIGHGRLSEVVLSKHMMRGMGNQWIAIAAASKSEFVFLLPKHSRC